MSSWNSTAGVIFSVLVVLLVPARSANGAEIAHETAASGPVWSINVVGLKGESLGAVTLEFSDEAADTCMSGNWKKARLVQSSFKSLEDQFETKGYFPTYEANGQSLEIQLNSPRLCDAYLMLSGKFTEQTGKGDYVSLGLGGASTLGTFTAQRQR